MNNTLEYNGVTYMVTSSLRHNRENQERGLLYNFSMAIMNPVTNRKQVALNCLTLVARFNERTKKIALRVQSPKQYFDQGNCASIVLIPDTRDPIQNQEREEFLNNLLNVVSNVADESIKLLRRKD